MSGNENSKSKDRRLEEKEKLEAELERSLAVAKVKAAHKQIEDTERLRKSLVALSICKRISSLGNLLANVIEVLNNVKYKDFRLNETMVSATQNYKRTYLSIRYDFQTNLNIGKEGMESMFPLLEIRTDIVGHLNIDLMAVSQQMVQMHDYCARLLI
jgi:hypothetical protein